MLTKAKRFFSNPIYLLATIVAVAVVGLGSMFAVRAFADGEVQTVPNDLITGESAHYNTATIDYLYLNNSYDWAQVYCSESETVEAELTHSYGSSNTLNTDSFKKNNAPFNVREYDSNNDDTDDTNYSESTVTITSDLPNKEYYVFQYDGDLDKYVYVGKFNIRNSTLLKKICVYVNGTAKNVNYDIHQLIADCGLDTSDVAGSEDSTGTYSASNEMTEAYPEKGNYNTDDPDCQYWDHQGESFSGGYASSILYKAGFDFNGATYSFVGLKQKTYYKYGNRITQVNSGVVGNYVENVSVILPKSTASGSRSYIGYGWDGNSDEYVMDINNYQFFPIDRRSLESLLGIPGSTGKTVMSYDTTGTTGLVLPIEVDVQYSVAAPSGATLTNGSELNNHIDKVSDNTVSSPTTKNALEGTVNFQPNGEGYSTPQCTIGGETKDATGWESVNDSAKTFGLSSTSSVRNIFSANNYTVNFNDGLITLTVPVKAVFPASATYTVTYHANGGTGSEYTTPAIASGDSHIVLAYDNANLNYTRDGYTFTGWNTESGGGGTAYSAGNSITVNANVDLYAQWEINKHDVTYELTGDNQPSVTLPAKKQDVEYNTDFTDIAEKLTATGYTFSGWKVKSGDVATANITNDADGNVTSFTMPDNDVTLQGTFTPIDYHVTYNVTGNVPAGYTTPTDSAIYHIGNTVTVEGTPNMTAYPNYTFDGWKKDGSVVTSFNMPASNVTLTGEFTYTPPATVTYTLKFDNNAAEYSDITGISNFPGTKTFTQEEITAGYTLPGNSLATVPTSENFMFVYWCTESTYDYSKVKTFVDINDFDPTTHELTLYASWVAKIEVTYEKGVEEVDDEGNTVPGSNVSTSQVFKVDEYSLNYVVLSLEEVTRESNQDFTYPGHTFTGWDVKSGGEFIEIIERASTNGASGASSAPTLRRSGAGVTFLGVGDKVMLHGDVVLSAHWTSTSTTTPDPTPTPSNVTLTYDANGGSPKSALPNAGNPITYSVGDSVKVGSGAGLKNDDLVFSYWSTTADDEHGSKHYNPDDIFTIEKTMTLYAIYKTAPNSGSTNEYTVTYDPNGGKGTTPTDSNQYAGGETVTVASKGDLVRTDCTFKEWNTAKDGSGTGYKGDGTDTFTMPQKDVTLYAIWLDGDGNYASPPTGESDVLILMTFSMTILALLAIGAVVIQKRKAQADS